jgi:Flp pilus assembly protein TadG
MKSEKGQATVEFALVITAFVLLVLGLVDFGRIFHVYLTLDHAGREAARVASLGATDSEIITLAKEVATGIDDDKLDVTISPTEADRSSEEYVTVGLKYPIDFLTPVIAQIISSFDLTDETKMRME